MDEAANVEGSRDDEQPDEAEPPTKTVTADPLVVELPSITNTIDMSLKLEPAGTFMMGSPECEEGRREDEHQHQVTISKAFYIQTTEVTQVQYERVMGVNPSHFKDADNPVENESWEVAVEFCRKLSELPAEKAEGNVYHVPTEAEWEHVCRAGTTTKFSFANDDSELGDYAWWMWNSDDKTHPVGSEHPNAWGLYDKHGNVWEWCQDWYGDYPSGAVTDPIGPTTGSLRVIRGHGWFLTGPISRSAYRGRNDPSFRVRNYGFRVCLSPSGK